MPFSFNRTLSALALSAFAVLASSCEKKFVEIVPVAVLERDASIPNAGDIKQLVFFTEQEGFAADTSAIYHTFNGGADWQPLSAPGIEGPITNLVFFDNSHGLCLKGGSVFATANAGITWEFIDKATFIGKTVYGKGVYGLADRVFEPTGDGNNTYHAFYKCRIFVSDDKGQTFQLYTNLFTENQDAIHGVVTGTRVLAVTEESGFKDYFFGVDLETGLAGYEERLYVGNHGMRYYPNDLYFHNGTKIVAGTGVEYESDENGARVYDLHKRIGGYESVSVLNGQVVAVGKNSLVSNIDIGDERFWQEMLKEDGQSFLHNFKKVQMVGHYNFYVSGENGLVWKMKY